MQRAKMEPTPGRSGDSHPCCLVEQQREEYVLPCPALPRLPHGLFGGITVFF